jgi:hypothetical protein
MICDHMDVEEQAASASWLLPDSPGNGLRGV